MESTWEEKNGRREYKGKQIRCLKAHYQRILEQDNISDDTLVISASDLCSEGEPGCSPSCW